MSNSEVAQAPKKMIVLETSDHERFEIEEAVALESQTIKYLIEDDCAHNTIPLPNVTAKTFSKVIEYLKKHHAAGNSSTGGGGEQQQSEKEKQSEVNDLRDFDKEFIKDVNTASLLDLILAANYLDIKNLLDLTCQTVANMIKDMSVEEVREIFGIENDFTPEEEAAVRAENAWAFEK